MSAQDCIDRKHDVCSDCGECHDCNAAAEARVEKLEAANREAEREFLREHARVEKLGALVRAIVTERHRCLIPTNVPEAPGLLGWDERARAALAGGGK